VIQGALLIPIEMFRYSTLLTRKITIFPLNEAKWIGVKPSSVLEFIHALIFDSATF